VYKGGTGLGRAVTRRCGAQAAFDRTYFSVFHLQASCLIEASHTPLPPSAPPSSWPSQFPGVRYMESYGATECGAITADGLPLGPDSGRASELRLEPITQAATKGGPEDCNSSFPFPRFGEMLARTPTMASGYWADAAATAAAFTPDGFYRTGDLCEARPDGTFAVVDRIGALLCVVVDGGSGRGSTAAEQGTGSTRAVISPAAIEARLMASLASAYHAAFAAQSESASGRRHGAAAVGLRIEQLCLVAAPDLAGGCLVAAVGLEAGAPGAGGDGSGGDEEPNLPPALAEANVAGVLRAAGAAAGLQPFEQPALVCILPRAAWDAAVNVQLKVVRGRVLEAVRAAHGCLQEPGGRGPCGLPKA
jgi:acyl-CoA synthetase (AMP-forming)/AMP-acid ligase II